MAEKIVWATGNIRMLTETPLKLAVMNVNIYYVVFPKQLIAEAAALLNVQEINRYKKIEG